MSSFDNILSLKTAKNGFIDHPMLSHIEGNLFVGMSPLYWPNMAGQEDFKSIFNFYVPLDRKYPVHKQQTYHEYLCYDSDDDIDKHTLEKYGIMIDEAMNKGPTLVHCQMGVNRSNLFAAAALIIRGRTVDAAIELLRMKRSSYVLMNRHFVNLLQYYYSTSKG